MTAYAREIAKGGELHDVIGRSLEDAGPSILFTSLVNFVAFATGSITPILVVQLFCQQMMVSVFLNFLFIIALLLPLTVVDGYRVTKGRAERPFWRGNIKNIQDDEADQDSRESVLAKFFGEYFGGFITNFWVKVSVIVAFLALFSVAAWSGFENNEVGLRISRVATDGTYQHDFSVLLEDKFQMFSAFVITNSETFDNPATQENVLHTVAELQSSVWVTDTYLVGGSYWLHTLLRDANADGSVTPLSSSEFYPAFANWLAALGVTSLPDLYCIDSVTGVEVSCYDIVGAFSTPAAAGSNANVKLVSTRGTFYQPNLKKTDDFLDAIESARGKVDWAVKSYSNYGNDPRYDSYVIGYIYILWEQ